MWKTFQNNNNLYMIKVEQEENLIVYLSDLLGIWSQNISKEFVLNQFQEANPLFDVKVDEAVTQVVDLINNISDAEDTEITNTSADTIHLALKSTKAEVDIKFSFDLEKLAAENFLKEITVPLIQTVRHLEEQQKILCNLIAKKDRELEEYKLEKGDISREDLISERFDEDSVKNVDKKSMMGVFGSSKSFWDTFVEQFGDITATIEDVQKDPWNHIQRKRKVYSSKTAVKKEISVDESDSASSDIEDVEITVPPLLPEKSKAKYELTYRRFNEWCDEQKVKNRTSEKVLLSYFEYLSKAWKPSSLCASYSILRTMISMKENLDIKRYNNLLAFLKQNSKGYRPKQSKILTKHHVARFLQEAEDYTFLLVKVALIIGLGGACKSEELTNLLLENMKDEGEYLHFTIPTTQNKVSREFFITVGDINGINMMEIIRKYVSLRPNHTDHRRFFIGYRKGKCTIQPVGINTFGSMPKTIAIFLNLPNSDEYAGNCFRRSSASLLADLVTIKRHGGWQSNTVIGEPQDIEVEECKLELEGFKVEKGDISQENVSIEKFDKDTVINVNANSTVDISENSESFWGTFVEQHDNVTNTVENVQRDPLDHLPKKRKMDSSEELVKKEISVDESDSASSDIEVVDSSVPPLLTEKSKAKYELTYRRFNEWCDEQKVKNRTSEKVLLSYFEYLSKAWKPSSLCASYSILRTMISMKENLDIKRYNNLLAFLKQNSKGYRPKQSKILTKQHVARFLQEADDYTFLLVKVALIIGLGGACKTEELTNLRLENVKDEGEYLHFTIPTTQNRVSREFFITVGDINGINMMEVIRKYVSLRPNHTDHRRFFIGYRKGKCTIQPVGINTFGSMPKTIAIFLNLPNSDEYAGNCFRRSSASLLADLVTIKRHGGWQSNTVIGEPHDIEVEECKLELEGFKLEQGDISQENLSTEKFDDEDTVINDNENSTMDILENSQSFWGTFIEQHDNITVENVQSDPLDGSPKKRKMDSSEELVKKETCMEDSDDISSDIEDVETISVSSVIPEKSRAKYELTYERFNKWCNEKEIKNTTSEKVLLTYFEFLSKNWKPPSLWSSYSMLRAMISVKENADISKYTNLLALLRQKSEGYRSKKLKIFTKQDVARFLQEANDYTYLMLKVALIIGLGGTCKKEELTNLLIDNVKDEKEYLHFTIPTTKDKVSREFFITVGDIDGVNMMEIIRKYIGLRPSHVDHRRFFVGYRQGKCTLQPVGVNNFGNMPKTIASFLKLPNPKDYTGNCFKRSSASLLANFVTIKRHGGWQSKTVIEEPQVKMEKKF